jgi:NADH-quinone oxidoreductase subunit A
MDLWRAAVAAVMVRAPRQGGPAARDAARPGRRVAATTRPSGANTGGAGHVPADLLAEYFPILVFLAVAGGIAAAMVGGSLLLARQKPNAEKLSTYECGFEPFDDTRRRFDVRFYLVAILFIIFDLEVAFLFPWAIALGEVGWFGFFSMIGFLAVLTVGFLYEWRKGALDWE